MLGRAVSGAVASMRTAAGAAVPVGDDAWLMEMASHLVELRALLDATEAHVLAELDARKATERHAGLTTGSWWARESGISVGAARRRVGVGRRLGESLPDIDAALSSGELSWERAAVIADETTDHNSAGMAAASTALLSASAASTFRRFATDVADLARRADIDGQRPADEPDRCRAMLSRHRDGSITVRGDWFGDAAVIVAAAIDRMTDELFENAERDREAFPQFGLPSRPELRAQAVTELCRLASATAAPTSKPPKVEASLVIHTEGPDPTRTLDGMGVDDSAAQLLCCDPWIRAIVVDTLGEPLDLGRLQRLVPSALRSAIQARDGGCIFSGCDAPGHWCDAHHVIPWDDGGPTSAANCRLLCRRHHRLFHRHGWRLVFDHGHADFADWPMIESPTGERRWTQRHGKTPETKARSPVLTGAS